MATQLNFLQKIVQDLIKAKHSNYSQDCLNFYIDDNLFSIEDIPKLCNPSKQRLKCSLIRHRKYGDNNPRTNSICIIYLHGFGSSRLQALPLIEHLPDEYCMCIFDMSGSGKSQGQKITYGLKQQEDIDPIIRYLHEKKEIKEFVIWGRSMGAVAALLYAINSKTYGKKNKDKKVMSVTQSLKNSIILSNNDKNELDQQITIHSLVLDSPFYKFSEVARQIAQKKLLIPSFLLEIALKYVEQSFTKLLSQSIGQKYNPFQINFDKKIKVTVPAIFVYSQNDEIISSSHSERLISQMDSKYRKVLISPCTHNQTRPQKFIKQIFAILDRTITKDRSVDRINEYFKSKQLSRSCDKKKGILVCTQSRDKKRLLTPSLNKQCPQTVNIQIVKTEQIGVKSPRFRSNPKKNMVTLEINRQLRKSKELQTLSTQKNIGITHMNSIDLQVSKFLNKKLIDSKQQGVKISRTNKKHTYDRRKDFQFYHERS